MGTRFLKVISNVLFLLPMAMAIVAFPLLPDTIPLQWNHSGTINTYGNRLLIFILPCLAIIVNSIVTITISRRNFTSEVLRSSYFILFATGILFNTLYVLMLILTFKCINEETISVQILKMVPVIIGIFIIILGVILTKTPLEIISIPEKLKPARDKQALFSELLGYNTILAGIFIAVTAFAFPLHPGITITGALIILVLGPVGIIKACWS